MVALMIDSMSLKEYLEYDTSLKRFFGTVDLGSTPDSEAKNATLAKEISYFGSIQLITI